MSGGRWFLVGVTVVASLGLAACDDSSPYDIAVFGDVPYTSTAVTQYERMIDNINASSAQFSVHVGDIGPATSSTCTTATVDRERARFDTFARPLVFTPGDNEWTDCGDRKLTPLSYIRNTIFRGTGTQSRGQTTMALASQGQSGYPENARWTRGPVTFATLHVVGSKDNYGQRSEHDPRRLNNIAWLRDTFTSAKNRGDKGVVLLAQTDPNFTNPITAYQSMLDAVKREALNFGGQTLYVHGDGHTYKNDRPLAGVDRLRRLQVEGDGKVSYVKIRIDPGSSAVFTVPQPTRF